ncbi:unnamed protein product [Rotaria magnacalcarata]|uniref:Uncharacterized protein n=1 Tax=Rotaria magnacalcarata TaxID=392030 RepID=A0A816QWC1_9BILA|nr:unnamed protein product [Rotaria magnacalcarata]CAF4306937.1 unnamed protein product [Rotaria magnacalcarata]
MHHRSSSSSPSSSSSSLSPSSSSSSPHSRLLRFIQLESRLSSLHQSSASIKNGLPARLYRPSSSSSSRVDRESFTSRANRRHREHALAAKQRAGRYYSHYLHSSDSKLDFGCGSVRCTCPLPITASFNELRAEGDRLRDEKRLHESAACMSQAMDTFLARAGRYYVPLAGSDSSSGVDDGAVRDLSSTPVTPISNTPVALDSHTTSDAASVKNALSADERRRVHATAQSIVDKLNRSPSHDWIVRKRRTAPELSRTQELDGLSDRIASHSERDEDEDGSSSHASSSLSQSMSAAHHHYWHPETDPTRAHEIAQEYQNQLRQQWLAWENQQNIDQALRNKK